MVIFMEKYRQRFIVIEAIEWTGDNFSDIKKFCKSAINPDIIDGDSISIKIYGDFNRYIYLGDWIVKNIMGGFDCIRSDIFEERYEKIE